ncbi:VOC family protein [Labilithrix luteola]|uniref:VOC family protein n=1 Tax=Labilithrix luteola TaxID=1391654 RepID=UPI0011BA9CA3|nr:VOC family protein [Labilithrix luteola]
MNVLNILARRCLPIADFDLAVSFHEALVEQKARLRFDYPEYNLKLAQIANLLFIGGTPDSLAPFTATHATFLVDDIQAFARALPARGAEILEAPKEVPTGWNMLVRHPDGTLVEYVEHRDKNPADRM